MEGYSCTMPLLRHATELSAPDSEAKVLKSCVYLPLKAGLSEDLPSRKKVVKKVQWDANPVGCILGILGLESWISVMCLEGLNTTNNQPGNPAGAFAFRSPRAQQHKLVKNLTVILDSFSMSELQNWHNTLTRFLACV